MIKTTAICQRGAGSVKVICMKNLSGLRQAIRIVIVCFIIFYMVDYLILRYRVYHRTGFGDVQVSLYYAVLEKNNHVEYFYGNSRTDQCVHSIFPHMGCAPCWHTGYKREERIDE